MKKKIHVELRSTQTKCFPKQKKPKFYFLRTKTKTKPKR
jgi:hypothetical protein